LVTKTLLLYAFAMFVAVLGTLLFYLASITHPFVSALAKLAINAFASIFAVDRTLFGLRLATFPLISDIAGAQACATFSMAIAVVVTIFDRAIIADPSRGAAACAHVTTSAMIVARIFAFFLATIVTLKVLIAFTFAIRTLPTAIALWLAIRAIGAKLEVTSRTIPSLDTCACPIFTFAVMTAALGACKQGAIHACVCTVALASSRCRVADTLVVAHAWASFASAVVVDPPLQARANAIHADTFPRACIINTRTQLLHAIGSHLSLVA
jgi:hypothetical protein